MSWRAFLAVLAVAAASVIAGLDWRTAPVAPPPAPVTINLPPAVPPVPIAEPRTTSGAGAEQPVSSNAPVLAEDVESEEAARAEAKRDEPPAPKCNIEACERAYRSFTPSDCTYQPFEGPRRLCTKP